jgi:hypothetical protein
MSVLATKLLELMRLADGGMGALTEHLLREVAISLISSANRRFEMIEWHIPLLIKSSGGRTAWRTTTIVGDGNKHEVVADYRASHPEVVGADFGQAWNRWL